MSSTPTPINEEIFNYILDNFSSEDEFLKNLKAESINYGMPEINISADQGAFLQFLISATGTKTILEIGSLGGYSAITMARALPADGKLIAVEMNSDYARFITMQAEKAGLKDKINVINAEAKSFLENYEPDFYFDLIFVDADKTGYKYYLNKSLQLLKKGGIFVADNALAFGEIAAVEPKRNIREVEAVREFNIELRNSDDFKSCLLAIGDGLALGLKVR